MLTLVLWPELLAEADERIVRVGFFVKLKLGVHCCLVCTATGVFTPVPFKSSSKSVAAVYGLPLDACVC